jgi:hypothetical protein
MQTVGIALNAFLYTIMGRCTGIVFLDSTPFAVCHRKRITRHRVFDRIAERVKTPMGWFYRFKLHLIINYDDEIIAFSLTPCNMDDRKPLPSMSRRVVGDKSCLAHSRRDDSREVGIDLVNSIRRNMKPQLLCLYDKLMLRRWSIIKTINDHLKNISQIEHSRHRCAINFVVNLFTGFSAYCLRLNKPSVQHDPAEDQALPAFVS